MNATTLRDTPEETPAAAVVVPVSRGAVLAPALEGLDQRLDGLLRRLAAEGALNARPGCQELIHSLGRLPAERLLLMGIGEGAAVELKHVVDWSLRTAKRLRRARVTEAAVALPEVEGVSRRQVARAVLVGLEQGGRDFVRHKTEGERLPELESVQLFAASAEDEAEIQAAIREGLAVGSGMSLARELGNEPANVATPRYLADRARDLASPGSGLTCQVLGPEEMAELGMGAVLGVARGSVEPPRFIILELTPPEPAPTLALVGKGLTFDAGGISIKPAKNMHEMKFDMCGGAAVLGAMLALSRLQPRARVVALVPATENMPSGSAIKPGDVLKSLSGLTIEVTNTDAEGRLVLADALAYARRYKPEAVVDIATLTGAIVIALGAHAIGLMGNDAAWCAHLQKSGMATGERVWQLPLWREYVEHMQSDTADLNNSSEAGGRAITAAAFLSRFAEGMRWAHLDIAGTAWAGADTDGQVKGATGSGVRTLVESVLTWPGPAAG